jgi:TolA-binding protein
MTKRQEALESMAQILQANPNLWAVAGDLFVKHMDWPGAQELSKRIAKTIDPKILQDDDKSPQLQAAEQQIQAMGQELDQMHQMLMKVNESVEVQEMQVKQFEASVRAYDAETKRISAMQAGMTPDQIQDIVQGTIAAAIETGDLSPGMPMMPVMEPERGTPMLNEGQMP